MNLEEAAEQWLHVLELRENKSPKTIKTYRVPLGHFIKYLEEIGKTEPASIVPDDVTDCADWLREDGRSLTQRSLVGYVTTMNGWVSWLALEEMVTLNVTAWQRLQKNLEAMRKGFSDERNPRVPLEQDVQAVLSAAESAEGNTQRKQLIALRNRAIAETLRSTGARVSEVSGLTRKALRYQTARVRGKGDKERMIVFDKRSWDAIQTYLAERDKAVLAVTEPEPVFARHDRRASNRVLPLSTNSIRWILDNLCKAGGAEHMVPHELRHRFATRMLHDTGNLAAVQKAMGHASPATTKIYAQVSDEDVIQAHKETEL